MGNSYQNIDKQLVLQDEHKLVKFWKSICLDGVVEISNKKLTFRDRSVKWGDSDENILFIRDCYVTTKEEIETNNLIKVMINGTPGIGKSLFIFWFMYKTVKDAKTSNSPIPTFVYSNRQKKQYFFEMTVYNEAVVRKYNETSVPTYFISDTVADECFSASKLNMHVSSVHDVGGNKFVNSFNRLGQIITLPTFSFDEYKISDGEIDNNQCVNCEKLQFLYDIFGGSLRLLRRREMITCEMNIFSFVKDEMEFYFQDVFTENSNKLVLEVYENECINACNVITSKLCYQDVNSSSELNARVTLRSLFKHHLYCGLINGRHCWEDNFSSGFMKSLAGGIIKKENLNIYSELRNIVGACGTGCLFERNSHEIIYNNLKSKGRYNLVHLKSNSKSKNVDLVLNQAVTRKVLIRRIEDIGNLLSSDYGLPVISNFPLIDAVIQPKFLLQMTEGKTHKGAITTLESICEQLLESDTNKHAMVFVLNENNYDNFKNVSHMPTINQYKTYCNMAINGEILIKNKKQKQNVK